MLLEGQLILNSPGFTGLQIETLHVNVSSKITATNKTGERKRAPDCSLEAGKMDVVLEILLLRLFLLLFCFNQYIL